jgi:hypothetical protein
MRFSNNERCQIFLCSSLRIRVRELQKTRKANWDQRCNSGDAAPCRTHTASYANGLAFLLHYFHAGQLIAVVSCIVTVVMWIYTSTPPYAFLTSALGAGEWPASSPSRFTPEERASGTNWLGGWVGPSGGFDTVNKRRISCKSNPKPPVVEPVASRYTCWAMPVLGVGGERVSCRVAVNSGARGRVFGVKVLARCITMSSASLSSQSELHYDWRFTANQFVLVPSPLRPTTRFFLTTEPLRS